MADVINFPSHPNNVEECIRSALSELDDINGVIIAFIAKDGTPKYTAACLDSIQALGLLTMVKHSVLAWGDEE